MSATLGAFLSMAAGPLARKVLAAIGVGVVSYTGLMTAIQFAYDEAAAALAGLPADAAAIIAIAGFFNALAIMAGGVIGGLAMRSLKRLAVLGA